MISASFKRFKDKRYHGDDEECFLPCKWPTDASSNSISEWLPAVGRQVFESAIQHSFGPEFSSIPVNDPRTHLNSSASSPQTLGSKCSASRTIITFCPFSILYFPPMISSPFFGVTPNAGAVDFSRKVSFKAASRYSNFCSCSNLTGWSPHNLSTSSLIA